MSFRSFYGGVDVMYYFGSSATGAGPSPGEYETVAYSTVMVGLELGYSLKVGIVTIRPQLGIGNLIVISRVSDAYACGNCAGLAPPSSSYGTSNLYLEPGVTGLVSFGTLFVGIDVNLLAIPNVPGNGEGTQTTDTALTLHGQVGVRF